MKAKNSSSRIGEIVAEMSSITEFAEGSIVSSSSYYTTKDGKRHKTRPQFKTFPTTSNLCSGDIRIGEYLVLRETKAGWLCTTP